MGTMRLTILILAEVIVLLALIWAGPAVPSTVAVAVPIVLVVLAMVVGGAARHIPAALRALASILRWER